MAHALDVAKAGFYFVVFDLSALSFEQNVRQTKEAVEALKAIKSKDPSRGRDWRHRNRIRNPRNRADIKGSDLAGEAKQFVESTGIDILAPAVGNMHGMLKSMVKGRQESD